MGMRESDRRFVGKVEARAKVTSETGPFRLWFLVTLSFGKQVSHSVFDNGNFRLMFSF